MEDANHVLFQRVLAKFVWSCFKEIFGWRRCPESLEDFHLYWLDVWGANNYHIGLFSFAALAWTLWKTKNKMAIERTFRKQPSEVVFKFMSCLQRWRVLIKEEERLRLEDLMLSVGD